MILRSVLGTLLTVSALPSVAAPPPGKDACPEQPQPEPAPLNSAGLYVPPEGETILFSAAPSFEQVRYVARVIRRPGAEQARVTLVRLKRRSDCNIHDRTGAWDFELSAGETNSIFRTIAAFEQRSAEPEVTLDGTHVQLEHHSSGKKVFNYSSNEPAKNALSGIMLEIMRRHVSAGDLPASPDWRTSARQAQNGK